MADLSRRKLLRGAVASAALIPLVNLGTRSAVAADVDMVPLTDPTAKALGYVQDATTAAGRMDKAGTAAADQMCSTCALYQGDDEIGPCTLFQGRYVNGAGWCTAWVPGA